MNSETKYDLNQETLDKVQQLIQVNIDSEDGFREAAKQIDDVTLASLFTELGSQRGQNAADLQQFVEWNGERAVDDGSYAAAFHRAWLDIRSKLSGGDAHSILCEAERGEDHIKKAYEDALTSTAGSAMNDVLSKQYANVKAGHDRIRLLRDEYQSR